MRFTGEREMWDERQNTHPIYLEALWLTIANMVHIKQSATLLAELIVLFNRLENRVLGHMPV